MAVSTIVFYGYLAIVFLKESRSSATKKLTKMQVTVSSFCYRVPWTTEHELFSRFSSKHFPSAYSTPSVPRYMPTCSSSSLLSLQFLLGTSHGSLVVVRFQNVAVSKRPKLFSILGSVCMVYLTLNRTIRRSVVKLICSRKYNVENYVPSIISVNPRSRANSRMFEMSNFHNFH